MVAGLSGYYWPRRMVLGYRTYLFCVLLFFSTPLFTAKVFAGTGVTPPAGTLRVAIAAEDYPPFYYQNFDGEMDGFSVRVLQALSAQLQLSLNWQRLPWNRVVHHLEMGRADLVLVMYHSDSRSERFLFSDISYLQDGIVLVCYRVCKVSLSDNMAELADNELALVRGFSYGQVLDALPLNAVTMVESDTLLLNLLSHGRLQLGIASYLTVSRAPLMQQQSPPLEILLPFLAVVDIYFAFSRHSALSLAQMQAFNQALIDFVQSPDYRALRAEFQLDLPDD
ncbi:substrate-binding periplasmic protein [Alkalimonas mucilaginosa]|uniref:Transporter substrate-binding domain-containing protein n=1 Tax=Alkalimonas mucilaginosa TaxID=3057676 RepID=A0ABU7JDS1_9GAMM|nr:transporter substrate-binding domain-containing protein [Alkalimonas sp. MEB004]MEE2023183.1 transporter substrate-binding domain-containing protein [Alkalimonas sp. MEB004]